MLTLLGAQTTEDETARRDRELEQLLLQVGRGDREAFAQLYGLTRGAVYALALSLLRDAHEAQDVAQDAFVKVWENAPSYRPQGSPMAWLLTVARNLARSRLRRSERQTTLNGTPSPPPRRTSPTRTGWSFRMPWPGWGRRRGRLSCSTP